MVNVPGLEDAQPHDFVVVEGSLIREDDQIALDLCCPPSY